MSEIAIACRGLGKQYHLGQRERYKTLRDTLADGLATPFRRLGSRLGRRNERERKRETIWALDDVTFDVQAGEVVGIIGRNGSGKSTLLKILSRITEPTRGIADIQGRVASLLEVGTGFNAELTGRENTYLNGAILGMRRAEIRRNFNDIVEFAEVSRFIDTPVKHYSTGMYMRLAFAVAAHLESEILLVDEVLSVGDAEFQRKCLRKMQEIGRGGRTILFVSHNMSAVRNICKQGIVLERGALVEAGEVNRVVDAYLSGLNKTVNEQPVETESFVLTNVRVCGESGGIIKTFDSVEVCIEVVAKRDVVDPGFYMGILTADFQRLTGLDFKDFTTVPGMREGERRQMGFCIESLPLLPGAYELELHLKDMANYRIEEVPRTFPFDVVETPVYGGRKIDGWFGNLALRARALHGENETQERPATLTVGHA